MLSLYYYVPVESLIKQSGQGEKEREFREVKLKARFFITSAEK